MKTTTLYENGNTFKLTFQRAIATEPNKQYFFVDGILYEVISKTKTNSVTITDEMSSNVLHYTK